MSSSLLPERPLLIFPTLATTIGLEEALMLQALSEIAGFRETVKRPLNPDLEWIKLSDGELRGIFPFWTPVDIKRVLDSLQMLGILLIEPLREDDGQNFFAIDDTTSSDVQDSASSRRRKDRQTADGGAASLIPINWQPDDNWIKICKQHSIPENFIRNLVPEFINYWRDRGQARFSWGNAFYKHALKEWRNEQSRKGTFELASTMSGEWRPSEDAVGILVNAEINASFIEDAIPEFVLYWRERGAVHGAWNTKFIEHIRRQWARFSASFGRDDTPQLIADEWKPSTECYEILQLAEIDEDYARSRIPEFVMYWKDSQQVNSSWNTVFLRFIKQDWARKLKQTENVDLTNAEDQTLVGSSQQRIKERFQRIADRSWAE